MKLLVSSAPHITGKDTTASLMRDLIIAMVPAMVASVFFFGVQSLILTAVSVLACVGFEFLYQKMLKKPVLPFIWLTVCMWAVRHQHIQASIQVANMKLLHQDMHIMVLRKALRQQCFGVILILILN